MSPCRCTLAVLALVLAAVAPAVAADPPAADPPAADSSLFKDGALFTPAPTPAAPPCHYCGTGFTTSPGGGAASHWGFGADCTAAQNDVRAQLLAYVNDDCQNYGTAGRCSFQMVVTWCGWNGSQYQADAYANYGCWVYYC